MTVEVASATMPLPSPRTDVCSACGEPIEDAVAVFSGVGRGHTFHVGCHGSAQPQTPRESKP